MPEASIVIKSTDRYSDAVKSMAKTTRAFTKDVDSLEEGLYALNKNKYTLKLDVKKAQQALKEAEKQFEKTGRQTMTTLSATLTSLPKRRGIRRRRSPSWKTAPAAGEAEEQLILAKVLFKHLPSAESAIVQSNSFLKEPQRLRGALSEVKAGCLFQMHFLWPHPEPLPVLWLRVRSVL